MTNDDWINSLTDNEKLDLFYGIFFALDDIHDGFEFQFKESDWDLFSRAFYTYFRPIYESMAGDDRIDDWYRAEGIIDRIVGDD